MRTARGATEDVAKDTEATADGINVVASSLVSPLTRG